MTIALIDYGSGNLRSAAKAFERVVRELGRSDAVAVTADPDVVAKADRVVLPGVGAFADCRAGIAAIDGMMAALDEAVIVRAQPFLGICVGMQLLADTGREDGDTPGLGWIPGIVDHITPGPGLRVPHVGWNSLAIARPHALLAGLGPDPHAYFTHSYAFTPQDPADIAATTDYGAPFTSAVARGNIFGTQFHPEMSQRVGLQLLANFLQWTPA